MKLSGLTLVFLVIAQFTFAQQQSGKKLITNEIYKEWLKLTGYKISGDGKYIWYGYGSDNKGYKNVLCSSEKEFKMEFPFENCDFSRDSKYAFGIESAKMRLAIIKTESHQMEYVDSVQRIDYAYKGSDYILYYQTGKAVLKKFGEKKDKEYLNVVNDYFNEDGTILLLHTKNELIYCNLKSGKEIKFPVDSTAGNISLSRNGKQVAFTTKDASGININYYRGGDNNSITIAKQSPKGIYKDYFISDKPISFADNENYLFVKLEYNPTLNQDPNVLTSNVNVWNYKDNRIQSNQLYLLKHGAPRLYTVVVNVRDRKITKLENRDSIIYGTIKSRYAILCKSVNEDEAYWNKSQQTDYDLVSLKDGKRKRITSDTDGAFGPTLSQSEKYVLWYNIHDSNFYCYDLVNDTTMKITAKINVSLKSPQLNNPQNRPLLLPIWLDNDKSLIVSDQFDLWQVDPQGKIDPINITGGFGRMHRISFKWISASNMIDNRLTFLSDKKILIGGFSEEDKHNYFFKASLGQSKTPDLLKEEAALYYYPYLFANEIVAPVKAKYAQAFLLQRQTAESSPNLVFTKDFKTFKAISDIHPEENYNWMTSKLLNWKDSKNGMHLGILYRPENFDTHKKYPVIFNYYENRSQELYLFKQPGLSKGDLNIPWYVSNGYLVFVPDIIRPVGENVESIVSTIGSAAKYLNSLPYVDSTRLGIQGHSYGGYETNVLVANLNLFAAAQSSAGLSDLVREYGDISFGDKSMQGICEIGQNNMGTTLFENVQGFISQSPFFMTDKIRTPVLLMHNTNDVAVPVGQSISFFNALRRLEKPVWMLQYDDQGHMLDDNSALDFTIRQQQFFDHYLKGKPAPVWMTEGIPAEEKGIKSGLQLDTLNRQP